MGESLFSKIVVAVDGSEPSRAAVAYASRLARDHGGTLLACYSADWSAVAAEAASAGIFYDVAGVIEDLKADGRELLEGAAATGKRFGVSVERHLPEGNPAATLLALAGETGCGLIVMGTHGRRGLRRALLGSTTEAVLRTSTIPVLTLRTATPQAQETQRCFERVLVGIDDSEPSDAALAVALDVAAEDLVELVCYTALDFDATAGPEYLTALATANVEEKHALERAVAAARDRDIPVRGFAVEGSPDEVLVAAAKDEAAGLIVVGSHGRRGLRRFFLGSVAEHVVRSATVPALVVRTAASVAGVPAHSLVPVGATA